ncbi:MAG: hypothetical protein CMF41_05070 [Legionellales bacterium]|nr:hypothetical protein [Legionellales bacterium]OUX64722.1 MAG: hypothetical protein CBE41_02725 [Gammaproteobacteria bacterium TMED281]|tara:strand:+ start:622 stop:1467 length:846 start_codon:yes stop_codon:yes gene_type:complete
MLKFKVTQIDDDARIDKFLKRQLPNVPYSLIYKLLRKGAIKINGKKVKQDSRVSIEDIVITPNISIDHIPQIKPLFILPITTVYEDDHLIIIDKPCGIAVQGGSKQRTNLIEQIEFSMNSKIYPVHRLDKETSGLIIFGKNNLIAKLLSEKFKSSQIKKTYIAIIEGKPKWNNKVVNESITKTDNGETKYLKATTHFQRKKVGNRFTMVEAQPITGRKHQIRLHLLHLGYPIYGDKKYNVSKEKVKRMYLHASQLTFDHPITKKCLSVKSPINDLTDVFKQ